MAKNSNNFEKRLDQYMNLMVDLRVSQVITDRQISKLGDKVDRIADSVHELRETVSVMIPIMLNHEEQMQKQEERMEEHRKKMEQHQESIDEHTQNIEDLYRSQAHFLRRLFGEEESEN